MAPLVDAWWSPGPVSPTWPDGYCVDRNHALGSDEQLGTLASLATAEISPVCAVLGGIIGNEVIKAISGKGTPANNMLMFDGMDGGCRSFVLQSKSN